MMFNREGRYWEKAIREVITFQEIALLHLRRTVITSTFSQYLPSLLYIISYYLPELEMTQSYWLILVRVGWKD